MNANLTIVSIERIVSEDIRKQVCNFHHEMEQNRNSVDRLNEVLQNTNSAYVLAATEFSTYSARTKEDIKINAEAPILRARACGGTKRKGSLKKF